MHKSKEKKHARINRHKNNGPTQKGNYKERGRAKHTISAYIAQLKRGDFFSLLILQFDKNCIQVGVVRELENHL